MSKDRFRDMKTTIIAVFWAVHPFEHVGKEIAQIERDSMDKYRIQNNNVSHFKSAIGFTKGYE